MKEKFALAFDKNLESQKLKGVSRPIALILPMATPSAGGSGFSTRLLSAPASVGPLPLATLDERACLYLLRPVRVRIGKQLRLQKELVWPLLRAGDSSTKEAELFDLTHRAVEAEKASLARYQSRSEKLKKRPQLVVSSVVIGQS